MGFFFRRSATFGPFRLNFSKSGIGASVGVRGARLTATPRGTTYITVGSHGFYYRETISNRTRRPVGSSILPPGSSPAPSAPPDEIVTADVSDLADSSCETLIRRLNERARMFNPAWWFYAGTLIVLFGALVTTSGSPDRGLPVITAPVSAERKSNSIDEYSHLVDLYGYPDSVLASEPLSMVSVRTVLYRTTEVKIVFVPNGCVGSYEEAMRTLDDLKRYPALANQGTSSMKPCLASESSGWTIVAYTDSTDGSPISAAVAKIQLDHIVNRQATPPIVDPVTTHPSKQKQRRAKSKKNTLTAESDAPIERRTWVVKNSASSPAGPRNTPTKYTPFAFLLSGLGLIVVGIVVHKRSIEQRTTRLFYELDETEQRKYSTVQQALSHLARSRQTWRIEARSATSDWKRNAGAAWLVRRTPASIGSATPPRVETNLTIPCVNLGQVKIFYLPDIVLYLERGVFGGIAYNDLRVEQDATRFIEDEQPPGDAVRVDWTWRYVRRDGGPDRRFNNNAQLPVMRYGVITLTSSRGLNIHLHTSSTQEATAFADSWRTLFTNIPKRNERQSATPHIAFTPDEAAFKMLGLSGTASPSDIAASYRRLAQMYHPDKVAGLAPEFQILANKRMTEINAAYETLKYRQPTEETPPQNGA